MRRQTGNSDRQMELQEKRRRGELPAGFQFLSEVQVGQIVANKTRRMGRPATETFLTCPNCFDERTGGGLIIDGFCTDACGALSHQLPMELVDPHAGKSAPGSSNRINWKTPIEGQSLLQRAVTLKADGESLTRIATTLSELAGRAIKPQNVAAHLSHHKNSVGGSKV